MKTTTIIRALFLLMTFVCYSQSASAEVEWTEIELEQEVQVKEFQDAFYTITPAESGIMKLQTVTGNANNSYAVSTTGATSEDGSVQTSWSFATDTDPSCLTFVVESGVKYYIAINFPMSSWSFKAKMGEAFAFTGSTPSDGGRLVISSEDTAYLRFTTPSVTFTEGELKVNHNCVKIYNFSDYNELVANGTFTYTQVGTSGVVDWNGNICGHVEDNAIAISFTTATGYDYYNVLMRMVEDGILKADDEIKLSMHGIRSMLTDELLNGDGELELTWYFGGDPTTLENADVPETIYSWYNEGDPEGLATFTFSRDIMSAGARLEMGMGEGADDLYVEEIASDKISFEGQTVTVDLSGVMRTKKTMNLKMDWPTFTLTLYGVTDIDGNSAYSPALSSDASFSFVAAYKDITGTISSEFTPRSGSTLTDSQQSIEIWFDNSNLIEWSGVSFIYYTEEEVDDVDGDGNPIKAIKNIAHETEILKADLDVTIDGDETVIVVGLPEGIVEATNVSLRVNITSSRDGIDHPIVAYYNTKIMYDLDLLNCADPASGSTLGRLSEITLNIGFPFAIKEDVDANPVQVYNADGNLVAQPKLVKDGMTTAQIVFSDAITKVGTYTVQIKEGVIGDYIYGESQFTAGLANKESTLEYTIARGHGDGLGIYPESGSTVSEISEVTITYSSPVEIDYGFWDSPAVLDEAGDLVIAAELIAISDTELQIRPYEKVVKEGTYTVVLPSGCVIGSDGKALATLNITYYVDGSADDPNTEVPEGKDPVISPAEGKVESLQSFHLEFPEWHELQNVEGDFPQLLDADGKVLQTAYSGVEPDWSDWSMLQANIRFDNSVDDEGDYTLRVPILLSNDWVNYIEKTYEFHYTVTTAQGIAAILAASGTTADIYSADGRLILRAANHEAVALLPAGLYVINGKKVILK